MEYNVVMKKLLVPAIFGAAIIAGGLWLNNEKATAPVATNSAMLESGVVLSIFSRDINYYDTVSGFFAVSETPGNYPGVGHAFANPTGMSYAPAETKDAWDKTIKFLKATLQFA